MATDEFRRAGVVAAAGVLGDFRRRLDRFCAAVFAGLAVRLAADIH